MTLCIIPGDDRSLDHRRREDDTEHIGIWHGCKSHLKLRRDPRINSVLYPELLGDHITFGPHGGIVLHNLARSRGVAFMLDVCSYSLLEGGCQVRSAQDS